ncbi:hypothetical protein HY522_09500 [bacterium]|nr:hypothetical protein [bacterium]
MKRRVLVVTHGRVGEELVAIARDLLGEVKDLDALHIDSNDSMQAISSRMQKWAARIESGDRGLVLTDLKNSSATVSALALSKKYPLDCVCGVNLPLLLKALSASVPGVPEILDAGRRGIDAVSPKSR